MTTFSHLLLQNYQQNSAKTALIIQHAGRDDLKLTREDILDGAAGYAHLLEQAGIQPGEVVILILQHGVEHVYAYFGAILHGAIPSIMPFLTEKLLPERYRADLAALLEVTRPAAILTYPEFIAEVNGAVPAHSSVRRVLLCSDAPPPQPPDVERLGGLRRSPEDIVLLQHSSGTTGLQKGVALSHRAVLNQLASYARALDLREDDVVVSWLPLYHDMGLIAGFLMPILLGIPLVLMSPFDWVRAPVRLLHAVSRYRGTLSWLPNFAYAFCAQKIRERDLQGVDLSSWRAVSNCSEPMRLESHQAFYQRFAPYGLRYEALTTCYAMAENVFAVTQGGIHAPVTVDRIDREGLQSEWLARPAAEGCEAVVMLSAGKPIENVEVKIVDAEGRTLADRQIGEIALRSNCMLSGYYNRPDATAKAFLDGWYLTGDFGYLAAGEVYITGRKKDLIIVGGKNVYPQDIEALAMSVEGVHPGRVVAFGVYNESLGTEEVYIVAEVESEDPFERERIADEVRRVVNQGSAIAVRQVQLVSPGWLIKTSSGKTARGANREKYLKLHEKV